MTCSARVGAALLTAAAVLTAAPLAAQSRAARPEDVRTIDGIVRAFYEIVSGPAGAPRDWARDSTLYMPGVRFVSLSEQNGRPMVRVMEHAEFARSADSTIVPGGFYEEEIGRVERRFGNLAHVFSSYGYRRTADGPVLGRGVNSLQLYWDGERWWIASAVWDDVRPDNPLPPDLAE